jgi:hypothetical protein
MVMVMDLQRFLTPEQTHSSHGPGISTPKQAGDPCWLGKSTQHQSLSNQGMPPIKVKTFWAREPVPPERLLETLGEIIRHQIVRVTKRTMNIE